MIALYIAGDLLGAPEREVAAHLAACEACRRLAEEFSESSSLLTEACTPPEFGAEFYSGIRCAVLGEIASDQLLSKPSLFRRPWIYATAFAAIVIVSGVMLQHFVSARRGVPQDLARAPQVGVQPTSGPTEVPSPRKKLEPLGTRSAPSSNALALASRHGSSRHFEGMRIPDDLVAAQAARDKQIELALKSSTSVGPVALEPSSRVSRIEIQTADPNIRIIWLSPSESREPSENHHDQDPRENGNRK
jgi:hypothetical protein